MTVCSGIGAPEVSAPWIDWRYQSEIEKFPSAVLAHRFPDAVNLGDMTKFKEWPDATVDVLCGGTPCQSFSVAGLRKGLADPRGNLMLTFLAIAQRYAPRWVVWENVPGVLSSNGGRDFGTFLGALGQLGYGWAYRVLDAQYVRTQRHPWAVPQRRRRVFVVGYLGDWRRAAAVLFEPESLRGDPAPRREARKGVAACAAHGVAIRGREGGGTAELTGDIATALRASSGGGDKPHALISPVAPTISARPSGGGELGTDFDLDGGLVPSVARSLRAQSQMAHREDVDTLVPVVSPALKARDAKGPSSDGDGDGAPLIPVAHSLRGEGFDASEDGTGRGTPLVPVALGAQNSAAQGDDVCVQHAPPLTTTRTPAVATPYAVRRLTPTECERLQGFPDGWTAISYRGKPADQCPDGPRYKALGNSWAVNCGEFIFERIRAVGTRHDRPRHSGRHAKQSGPAEK